MAFEKLRERLHHKQGERVFLEAQRALMEPPRMSAALIGCYAVALLILLIPTGIIALALWMIIGMSEHMFAILGGLLLLAVGYILLPRPYKNETRTLRRADLPQLYTMLDDVAEALGTTAPDGVAFDFRLNAAATTYGLIRRERVLTIGVPLWQVLDGQERVALLAHEIVHFANNDPARGGVIGAALHTVERWDFLWNDKDDNLFARDILSLVMDAIQWLLRMPVNAAGALLLMLAYNASQRAEYLANGRAAQVAGRDPLITSFRKLALMPLAEQAIPQLYPYSRDQNARIFDVMVTAMQAATPEERVALEAAQARDKTRMDKTHPPIAYVIAFVELLEDAAPMIDAATYDFDAIAVEIQSEADRQGKRLMQRYEVV